MLLRLVARPVCANSRRHCQFKPTLLIVRSQCPDLGWRLPLPCLGNASEWQNHDHQCRIYRLTSHCTDGLRGWHHSNWLYGLYCGPYWSQNRRWVVLYLLILISFLRTADYFLNNPGVRELVRYIDAVLGFFVVETKSEKVKLHDCLPQVLAQLYASATKLKCGTYPHLLILHNWLFGQEKSCAGYTDKWLWMAVYRCFFQSWRQRSLVHDFNWFVFSSPPRNWWQYGRPWGPGWHDSRHTCILGRLPATWNVLRCGHSTRSNIAAKTLARMIGSRWGRKKCMMPEDSVVHHPFISAPSIVFVH